MAADGVTQQRQHRLCLRLPLTETIPLQEYDREMCHFTTVCVLVCCSILLFVFL